MHIFKNGVIFFNNLKYFEILNKALTDNLELLYFIFTFYLSRLESFQVDLNNNVDNMSTFISVGRLEVDSQHYCQQSSVLILIIFQRYDFFFLLFC